MKALVLGFGLALLSVSTAVYVSAGYNHEDVFAPPKPCGKVKVKGHYNKQGHWVPTHWKQQYWVEGHYSFGKWVPGHCH